MDRKKRQQILQTPAGAGLNALVELHVHGRQTCQCGPIGGFDPDTGTCSRCGVPPSCDYSGSARGAEHLLAVVRDWPHRKRLAFCDGLGLALSARMETGHIEPRQWILWARPEDIARASVLACLET